MRLSSDEVGRSEVPPPPLFKTKQSFTVKRNISDIEIPLKSAAATITLRKAQEKARRKRRRRLQWGY
jgi:hypothetical protein